MFPLSNFSPWLIFHIFKKYTEDNFFLRKRKTSHRYDEEHVLGCDLDLPCARCPNQ